MTCAPTRTGRTPLGLLALALAVAGCDDIVRPVPMAAPEDAPTFQADAPPPELADGLRTISFGSADLELWPFTGSDLGGTPSDPVNLVFLGEADPANLRSLLLALDGDRTAFGMPDTFPFDCTWRDAAGALQAGWAGGRWIGSAVQLECGEYGSIRFHLRLFPSGAWTVASAHFEVLIPGTTDHQVLSWDLARDLVQVDLLRSGLLDPGAPFGAAVGLTPAPTFREVPPVIFNALPPELQALTAGAPGPVSDPVGIANDGTAVIANVAGRATPEPGARSYDMTVDFDQVIPKPFCGSSDLDLVHVAGPVRFTHRVAADQAGEINAQIHVSAELVVTPIDPGTGAPSGEPGRARVSDHFGAASHGGSGWIDARSQRLLHAAGSRDRPQVVRTALRIAFDGRATHTAVEECGG